ncbi:Hypothetical protein (plasmid) [Pseudomonas putida]|nr:Hypothetical protein [Pseudomonas putida]
MLNTLPAWRCARQVIGAFFGNQHLNGRSFHMAIPGFREPISALKRTTAGLQRLG